MEKYTPVHCSFHDELELLAWRNISCEIVFKHANEIVTIQQRIKTFHTRAEGEFLETESGSLIRLDQLIRVGNFILADYK